MLYATYKSKSCRVLLCSTLALFLSSSLCSAREPSPESVVMMAYISTLRCKAQHPRLRKGLNAAYKAWEKRNKKYVDSAHKMLDFKGIAYQYKTLKKHDKRIPFQTCLAYIKRLRDPANDAQKHTKSTH